MAVGMNGKVPGRCCEGHLHLFPRLTLTSQHKCLMCDLMVHTTCSREDNEGYIMCFLCDSVENELPEAKDEEEVHIPTVVQRAIPPLHVAIELAKEIAAVYQGAAKCLAAVVVSAKSFPR
jgi:hypothetical protein